MEEEAFLKQYTDCVYFLASPLTCKKGIECEYRHSEIARHNPRECWYWLARSCFNIACGYRHPPLDGNTEAIPESVPGVKTKVPCYYFLNGYCNKDEKCSFLHGIDPDPQPKEKPMRTILPKLKAPRAENNTNRNSKSNSFVTTMMKSDTNSLPKEDHSTPLVKDVSPEISSPKISVSDGDETATIRSDSYVPESAFEHTIPYLCEEDYVDDEDVDLEREERLESSPGFDVLVHGESENNGEYFPEVYRGRTEHEDRYPGYDFETRYEYDSSYLEMDSFPVHGMFDPVIPRESNHLNETDLRDELTRRRFVEDRSYSNPPQRHESDHLIGRTQEHPCQHQQKRPAQAFRRYDIEPSVRDEILRNRERPFRKSRPRRQYKETRPPKRPRVSSEVSREMVSRNKERSDKDSGVFSGPKTLSQIREEKRRLAGENGKPNPEKGCFDRKSKDFDGPKPLSEILKEKRRAQQ